MIIISTEPQYIVYFEKYMIFKEFVQGNFAVFKKTDLKMYLEETKKGTANRSFTNEFMASRFMAWLEKIKAWNAAQKKK